MQGIEEIRDDLEPVGLGGRGFCERGAKGAALGHG
jgi:hypothetical protein